MVLQKSKILIVDDSTVNLDLIISALGESYDLRTAIDGEIALTLIATGFRPDLILLDIMMPGIDGYEVYQRLKSDQATQHTPVIFLTSLDDEEDEEKGLELGVADYITKPFNPAILRRRISLQLELKLHQDQLQDLVDKKIQELDVIKKVEREKDALLQSILMSVPVAIGLIIDQKIVWTNQRTSEITGYTCAELEGQPTRVLYSSAGVNKKVAEMGPEIPETGVSSFATIWRTKSGVNIDVHVNAAAVDKSNIAAGVIFAALDITELRKLEEESSRANRLASLGELAAGVAHEINNPNALILYNSDILDTVIMDILHFLEDNPPVDSGQLFGGLPYREVAREIPILLPTIHDSAQRIKRIVNDLRDFARQDNLDIDDAIHVNQVVHAAVRLVNNAVKKTTDCFTLDLAEILPTVTGVTGRLEQVVINLLLNACQALEDRSQKISITTAYDAAINQVQMIVADEGRGMSTEVMEHALEPFVTTKREQGGTGLGLSVSARIVKEHNGTLELTSTLGEGTTATVSLPVHKEDNHVS